MMRAMCTSAFILYTLELCTPRRCIIYTLCFRAMCTSALVSVTYPIWTISFNYHVIINHVNLGARVVMWGRAARLAAHPRQLAALSPLAIAPRSNLQDRQGSPIYNPAGKYMVKLKFNGIERRRAPRPLLPATPSHTSLSAPHLPPLALHWIGES